MSTPVINQPTPNAAIENKPEEVMKAEENKPEAVETPEVKPVSETLDVPGFNVGERVPSDWEIQPDAEDGFIIATNTKTNRVFQGSIAEFSANLRKK